jgi:hypothetical protein
MAGFEVMVMKMLQRMFALALLGTTIAAIAACAPVQLGTAPATGAPVQLRTASAAVNVCDDAIGSGRLVANAQTGLALSDATGTTIQILWPFGYSARREGTGVALLDETGKVVAHEGDFVQAGGGTGNEGLFAVCAGSVKVVPPPK